MPLEQFKALLKSSQLLMTAAGIGLFVAAGVFGPKYVGALRVVGQPTIPPEGTNGVVRSYATFHPEGSEPVPPCLVRWQSGKSTYRATIAGDNRVDLGNGRKLNFRSAGNLEFFLDEGPFRPRSQDHTHEQSDALWKKLHKYDAYRQKSCLSEDEIVWVEACARGDQLVACDGEDAVLITSGNPKRHRMYTMCRAHGAVGFGMLGFVFLLHALNARRQVSRRIVEDLAYWRKVWPGQTPELVIMVLLLAVFISFTQWTTTYGPWVFFACAVGITVASIVLMIMRRRVLRAAREMVEQMQTSRIHSREGGVRELAVRVDPNVPTIAGFHFGSRHAFVQYLVQETYKERVNNKTLTKTRDIARGTYPATVPVVDESGAGVLDTTHCALDSEPQFDMKSTELPDPGWLAKAMGQVPRSETHDAYAVKWRVAQPGAPLLIYGGVERVSAEAIGAEAPAQYRSTPDIPIIRGSAAAPVLVHVGNEAELLASIRGEISVRSASIAALSVTLVVGAILFVWVVSIAP